MFIVLKAERHQLILAHIQQNGVATVKELAHQFDISPITVRRDLLELGERGALERTHGGAVINQEVLAEGSARYETFSYVERHGEHAAQKAAIAECAAQFICDGDTILINAGTTAHALACALRGHRDLHVITNGLSVATALAQALQPHVYVLPGRVDCHKLATIQRPDNDAFGDIRIREAFLGVHALTGEGIYMRDHEDAILNRAFMKAASCTTVIADHSKCASHASFRIDGWQHVHRLVTDKPLPSDLHASLERQGVDVIIAAA